MTVGYGLPECYEEHKSDLIIFTKLTSTFIHIDQDRTITPYEPIFQTHIKQKHLSPAVSNLFDKMESKNRISYPNKYN